MALYASVPNWIQDIPDHLKTQEIGGKAVRKELGCYDLSTTGSRPTKCVPKQYTKSHTCYKRSLIILRQEMCIKAVCKEQYLLNFVLDHFKTQEMCADAVFKEPWPLVLII